MKRLFKVWKEKAARGSLWTVDPAGLSSTGDDDTSRGAE